MAETASQTARSRAARQAETRRRLIDVARRMFLDDGYAATSLDKVAVEAGYSKGAVYSNFSGKEELCLAVLDSLHERQVEGVVSAFSGEGDLDARIDAFARWARSNVGRPRAMALEVELAVAARHSAYVAEELRRRHREIRSATAGLIREVVEGEGLRLAYSYEEAATVLLSLGVGLGALRSIDHEVDVELFGTAMRALLAGATRAGND
ncbi:TetR/AcrR family transcriptional regulator [Aeromicrobium massiliense]|uniref:TetR/AcrR family transcriptional regulator n=1 Tax=Aeromicrobium massiliense TaxID=1464554 RepID=UPI00031F7AA3|nr:TetR/AcrR family transcriptional regulator [Aeromicrobium massiliense]